MESVVVDKAKLLEKLKENRELHKREYDEAVIKHRDEVITELQKRLRDIEAGEKIDLSFNLPTPREFLDSFDEAIAMLEWEQGETVELEQHDFQRYVMNKWEWRQQFQASTALYNARP